eukprot:gene715-62_t
MVSLGPTAGMPVGTQYGTIGGNSSLWTSTHNRNSEMRLNAYRLGPEVARNLHPHPEIFPNGRSKSARAQRKAYRAAMKDFAAGPVWRTNQPHQSFTAAHRTRPWHPALAADAALY